MQQGTEISKEPLPLVFTKLIAQEGSKRIKTFTEFPDALNIGKFRKIM